jgi:hypothetical protein
MIWPSRRPDGSVSVAARYSVSSEDSLRAVRECVARVWAHGLAENQRRRIAAELDRRPYVVERGKGQVDIVIDGRPHSRLWKSYLVDVAKDVSHLPGTKFEGFWDLVTDTPHQASIRVARSRWRPYAPDGDS